MKKIVLLLCACMCGWSLQAKQIYYDYTLSEVTISKNGNTVTANQPAGSKYADSLIQTAWLVGQSKFNFELTNATASSIKLVWNDVVYVDKFGNVSKVMHKGIKYMDRENSQQDSNIPAGGKLDDAALPNTNVRWSSSLGEWIEEPLFVAYIKKSELEKVKQSTIGKTIKLIIPLIIGEDTYEYTFSFTVKDVNWVSDIKISQFFE